VADAVRDGRPGPGPRPLVDVVLVGDPTALRLDVGMIVRVVAAAAPEVAFSSSSSCACVNAAQEFGCVKPLMAATTSASVVVFFCFLCDALILVSSGVATSPLTSSSTSIMVSFIGCDVVVAVGLRLLLVGLVGVDNGAAAVVIGAVEFGFVNRTLPYANPG
jgi:hypothetical protein